MFRWRRSVSVLFPVLFLLVLPATLTSCTLPALAQRHGPKPPINNPNLLGKPNQAVQSITTLKELTVCLDTGKAAYGVTTNTTNVRTGPATTACRLGKLAKGAVVEITGYTPVKPAAATAPAPGQPWVTQRTSSPSSTAPASFVITR